VNAPELSDSPPKDDWLLLWRTRAEMKRSGLETDGQTVSPIRSLRWPLTTWFVNPKRHLKALKVPFNSYDLVDKGPPSRDFKFHP
jgi:hypothetical protein